MKPFFLSHILKPKFNFVKRLSDKKEVCLTINIITSIDSQRKTIVFVEDFEKSFYNVSSIEEMNKTIKVLLSRYFAFESEILSFDKDYPEDFVQTVISSFIKGDDVQRAIGLYNLNKG